MNLRPMAKVHCCWNREKQPCNTSTQCDPYPENPGNGCVSDGAMGIAGSPTGVHCYPGSPGAKCTTFSAYRLQPGLITQLRGPGVPSPTIMTPSHPVEDPWNPLQTGKVP